MARPDLDLSLAQVEAVKALHRGEATKHQQEIINFLLLHQLCGVDADCFADDERQTVFDLGRRWVGLRLREMMVRPIDQLLSRDKLKTKPEGN